MNRNLIIQGVLAIAVVVLFVLHFVSPGKSDDASGEATPLSVAELSNVGMAYVNLDTLVSQYQMYVDLRAELKGKMEKREAELNNKAKKHQADVADFQNKANKGLETRSTLETMSNQLAQNEQALMQLQSQYSQELAEEEVVANRKVLFDIMEYLKEYNKDKNLQFIFSNTFGGALLFSNPSLDITGNVLEGLNARYAKNKPKK